MKFTCKKNILQESIYIAQKAVTGKTTMPILGGILIKAVNNQLILTGSDTDLSIITKIPVDVEEEGEIVVDAQSIGLLVSDVMPICMIIALDIVMTLRGSINCSTVICSPTVILAILREASSEHYGPQGLLHTIFSALHFLLRCTFRLQISLCKQS